MDILLAILFVVLPVIVLIVTALVGKKRNIYQSVAKLILTILAIVISVIITKIVAPNTVNSFIEFFEIEISTLMESGVWNDVLAFISAAIMPAVFFTVFVVVAIVFAILYIIPSTILKKKFTEDQQGNDSAKRTLLRVGSIVISLVSALLVLSHFALPVTFYSNVTKNIVSIEYIEDTEEVEAIVNKTASHPVVSLYSVINAPATSVLEQIKTSNGGSFSVSESVELLNAVLTELNTINSEEVTADTLYSLARKLEENPDFDHFLADLLKGVCAEWEKDNDFLGVEKAEFGDEVVVGLIIQNISDCDKFSSILYILGDAMKISEIMAEQGIGEELFNYILLNSNADTVKILGSLLSNIAADTDYAEEIQQYGTPLISGILKGVAEIKQNDQLSDDEKTAILNKEAKVFTKLYQFAEDPKSANPQEIGEAIAESYVFSETIKNASGDNDLKYIFGFEGNVSGEFMNDLGKGLEQGGVSKSDPLHGAVASFFGK